MRREAAPLEAVARTIRAGSRFVATTHVNPDGDGVGSGLALVRHLRGMGKQAHLAVLGKIPPAYAWLPRPGEIVMAEAVQVRRILSADAVFVLDLADWRRLGRLAPVVRAARGVRVTIDHHPEIKNGSDIYWRDLAASSVGEMVFRLIGRLSPGRPVARACAEALYVSLMTDTGCFRFSNTDVDAHEMAATLIRSGVRTHEIYSAVYEVSTLARLRLLGAVLSRARNACGGELAWAAVRLSDLRRHGARAEETEGFIDVVRTLRDAEVTVFFKEAAPGVTCISFRSRSRVDVNRLAATLGGGGHARASGTTLEGPFPRVVSRVLASCRKALRGARAVSD